MKNHFLPLLATLLPRKRSSLETLCAKLKRGMGLGHTRHRSPINASLPILSCRAAYSLAQPKANMGTLHLASLSSPYPQLGLYWKLQDLPRLGGNHKVTHCAPRPVPLLLAVLPMAW